MAAPVLLELQTDYKRQTSFVAFVYRPMSVYITGFTLYMDVFLLTSHAQMALAAKLWRPLYRWSCRQTTKGKWLVLTSITTVCVLACISWYFWFYGYAVTAAHVHAYIYDDVGGEAMA